MAPPLLRTTRRLLGLVGGLHEPAYRWRLIAALALTLFGKVLAVFSPLVLADGINKLARGQGDGVYQVFIGLAVFWAALRFASTAGPQLRDALFQPVSEEAQRRAGTRVFSHVMLVPQSGSSDCRLGERPASSCLRVKTRGTGGPNTPPRFL